MNTQKTSAGHLTELLQRLSEIEPAVCRLRNDGRYVMRDYVFWSAGEEIGAQELKYDNAFLSPFAFGQPVLDWLAGAVMRECERRAYWLEIKQWADWEFNVKILYTFDDFTSADHTDYAHALLAAFVAAVSATK